MNKATDRIAVRGGSGKWHLLEAREVQGLWKDKCTCGHVVRVSKWKRLNLVSTLDELLEQLAGPFGGGLNICSKCDWSEVQ